MDQQTANSQGKWIAVGSGGRNAYRVSSDAVDLRRPLRAVKTAALEARAQNLIFDVNRAALVIVDMQNDFCSPDGWMGSLGADVSASQAILPSINAAAAAFRKEQAPVIWVNWGVRPDRLNLSPGTQYPFNPNGMGPGLSGEMEGKRGRHHVLREGSWGAAIVDGLDVEESDIRVSKHRISGFWDTPLDSILRNLNIATVFFAGVNTDHCVLGTLMDANFLGYDTIMLEDCVATTSPDYCTQATFTNVQFCFGFSTSSGSLVKALGEAHE